MTLYRAGTLVTGSAVFAPGWFTVEDGVVAALGSGEPVAVPDVDLGDGVVVPGFVDMHVHGGGGFAFDTATPEAVLGAAGYHRRHGTTTLLAGLVTASLPVLERRIGLLRELTEAGAIAGVYVEGPWLSAAHPGAHDVPLLRDPEPAEVASVLKAGVMSGGANAVRMVTLAAEREGGLDAVRTIVDAGAVAALGHTAATFDQAHAAVDAGVTVGTHLFNGMPGLHHREPGAAGALLSDPRVTVELIADGVHLHPATVDVALRAAGPDRAALVTDAMAAAGMGDGSYQLGALPVTVSGGVARVESGSIAGSLATMDAMFRTAFSAAARRGRSPDAALLAASLSTSVIPARTLGLDVGTLDVGRRADAVVLAPDTLEVRQVLP